MQKYVEFISPQGLLFKHNLVRAAQNIIYMCNCLMSIQIYIRAMHVWLSLHWGKSGAKTNKPSEKFTDFSKTNHLR